jgi:hypothetical protein
VVDQTYERSVTAAQHSVAPGGRHPVRTAGRDVDLDDRQRRPTCP